MVTRLTTTFYYRVKGPANEARGPNRYSDNIESAVRTLAISCMALLLLAALVGGPCASCLSSVFAGAPACCGHCGKSGKCTTAPADLSNLQKAHSGVSFSLEPNGAVTVAGLVRRDRSARIAADAPYSPPDLYLRNSVLNI